MNPESCCFLFDIDGTLLTVGHRGRVAFCEAVAQVCRVDTANINLNMAGRTDLSIIQEALSYFNIPQTTDLQEKIFHTYVNLLNKSLHEPDAVTVFEGAFDLLKTLSEKGATLAVGTGNIQAGAKLKMELAGLWSFIKTGGYGDDHLLRDRVLAKGVERARQYAGREFSQVWVVGDTPLDIAAGRAIGAKICAIANGRFSIRELRKYEPDLCYNNLKEAEYAFLEQFSALSN